MKQLFVVAMLLAGCNSADKPTETVDKQARADVAELRKKFDDDLRNAIAKLDVRAAAMDKRQEELAAKESAVVKRENDTSVLDSMLRKELDVVRKALLELGEKAGELDAMQKKATAQYEKARGLPPPKVDQKALLAQSRAELEALRKTLPTKQQAILNAMGKVTRLEKASNGSDKSLEAIEAAKEDVRRLRQEQESDALEFERLEGVISDLSGK